MVGVRERHVEILVGIFILLGTLALCFLAIRASGLGTAMASHGYRVTATFDNVGDLKIRAPVTIAGVRIGEVTNIQLNTNNFKAIVTFQIDKNQNQLPTDTSASIFTQGLLGSNYISLNPGFDETMLKEGDQIINTHPALVLENLIGQFLFKVNSDAKKNS